MMKQSAVDRCILRWPTSTARIWTREFLQRARRNRNVLAVVAIGSAVREGVRSDDLDILVLCEYSQKFSERAPLEIDLRALDAQSVDSKIEAGHDLLGWAVVFGRILYDRKETWVHIVERWRGRVPLPDPAEAKCRSDITRHRMQEMREMGDEDAAIELELAYLSHDARATLAEAGIYPASRPELPRQLTEIGADRLAAQVQRALDEREQMRSQMVC